MFLIVWMDQGFDEMNEIVHANPSRKHEFAVALRRIGHQLTTDPFGVGESRGDDARVMFAGELSVFYSVDTGDNTVRITNVWLRRS